MTSGSGDDRISDSPDFLTLSNKSSAATKAFPVFGCFISLILAVTCYMSCAVGYFLDFFRYHQNLL
jgi:hypothetical protein